MELVDCTLVELKSEFYTPDGSEAFIPLGDYMVYAALPQPNEYGCERVCIGVYFGARNVFSPRFDEISDEGCRGIAARIADQLVLSEDTTARDAFRSSIQQFGKESD